MGGKLIRKRILPSFPPYAPKTGTKGPVWPENPGKTGKIDSARDENLRLRWELEPRLSRALVVLSKEFGVLSKALDKTTRVWGPEGASARVVLVKILCVRSPE
jgi:hypothetical protein